MDGVKPPVLTSPGKVGFFVSLMLLAVSFIVGNYFVTAYGIELGWQNLDEWLGVIHGQGLLFDMLPLIALVGFTSLLSFLVILRGVQKYKRYLDSGLDYKNLLSVLHTVDDLDDVHTIDKLKYHPELRNFLIGVRDAVAEREKELIKREAKLGAVTDAADEELSESVQGEELILQCDSLVSAIRNETDGPFVIPEDVSSPVLLQVAGAVKDAMEQSNRNTDDAELSELEQSNKVLRNNAKALAKDIVEIRDAATEIGEQLKQVALAELDGSDAADDAGKQLSSITAAVDSFQKLSGSLTTLGEEAKGIAINTALQAGSGDVTQADLIQLAEDVRGIASMFNETSKECQTTAEAAGQSAGAIAEHFKQKNDESLVTQALESVSVSVMDWAERLGEIAGRADRIQDSFDSPNVVDDDLMDLTSSENVGSESAPMFGGVHELPDSFDPSDDIEREEPLKNPLSGQSSAEQPPDPGFESLGAESTLLTGDKEEVSEMAGLQQEETGVLDGISKEEEDFEDLTDEVGVEADDAAPQHDADEVPDDEMAFEAAPEAEVPTAAVQSDANDGTQHVQTEAADSNALPDTTEPLGETFEDADRHVDVEVRAAASTDTDPTESTIDESTAKVAADVDFETFQDSPATSDPAGPVSPGLDLETGFEEMNDQQPSRTPQAVPSAVEDVVDLYELGAVDFDPAVHG